MGTTEPLFLVMAGFPRHGRARPGHPRLGHTVKQDVDGRVKPRHDGESGTRPPRHCEPPGRRKAPPDDRLREAIHLPALKTMDGLLRRCAPCNDGEAIAPNTPCARLDLS